MHSKRKVLLNKILNFIFVQLHINMNFNQYLSRRKINLQIAQMFVLIFFISEKKTLKKY